MTARGHIENLMALYTEALDDARFDDLGGLFTIGSVRIEGGPHHGASAHGRADVGALYRAIVALDEDGRTSTRHFISNLFISVDGEHAEARSYFAVSQQTQQLALQLVACGGYHDTFRLVEGAWHFDTRHIICDQVGDLSQHMR